MGNNWGIIERNEFKEKYVFIEDIVFYFIKEILMYDDEQYRNDDYNMDNTLVYLNNIIKKLLIETYYKLTGSEEVVNAIKSNPLYGINRISSDFLSKIVDKSRSRVKGK